MAVEDRSLSEFPRALQVAEQALVMISNPDGLGGYDTNGAVLTEVGKALLNVQYTQQLGNVSVFDAIKNTRVLSGTTTPLANEGANGQLYVKYETVSNVDNVVGMYFKKDGAWLEISLGGGGGASVTLGTTVPSDASGDNGDLYVQYDSSTYAVVEYFVKVNNSWRIAPYSRVVSLTQAQYDLITPDPTTLYIITDAQSSYQTKSDNSLATADKTVVGAINELNGRFDYLTTEKAVGTWVDGKTIYKKTIYIASMPDGSTTESEYLIGDFLVDMVVDYSSTLFVDDKSQFLPMPYIFTALNTAYIQLGFKNKNNKFYVGIRSAGLDRSSARGYVTAYYTKQ